MTTTSSKKTFDQWIAQAQSLRRDALTAEARLLFFLVEFEESGAWKDSGCNTFVALVKQYKLTRPERYANFKAARGQLDDGDIEIIGCNAAIQAGKIRSAKARSEYVREAKLRVEQDGFPWSVEQAERQRMRIAPDSPQPLTRVARESRTASELAEAEQTIAALKEQIAELKQENSDLKRQLRTTARPAPGARMATGTRAVSARQQASAQAR